MLKFVPYKIQSVEEAKNEGYVQMGFHAPNLKPCLEFIEEKRDKARWLRLLTRDRINMLWEYLDLSPLRCSFIIVDQHGHSGYREKSFGNRYCIWRRDITRDN